MRATCVMSFRTLTLVYLIHLREDKKGETVKDTVGWRDVIFSVFAQFRRPSFQIVGVFAVFLC